MDLRDLIVNTEPVHTAADFLQYVHRMRHWDMCLIHILQHADLASASKLAVEILKDELHTLLDFCR
jgi:hypothetical protein